ncbi:MAG: DUF6067 family protein, partial [Phycisphaerae bacterium]|nr:DUF6067 family protein [Phycisphaerae bacterium]
RAEALTIELATQDADIAACCDRITAMNTEARLLAAKTATWQSLRELPKPDVRFIARAAESLDKVYRDRKWPESTAATLNAEMAANEYESVQLVIVPLRGKLNDVQVRCGSLRSGDAVITDVEARPVADVFLPIAGKHGGWRPDVLLGAADFDVPTDRAVQAVWITIHTQPDTVAGRYSGVVTVSAADSTSVTLPITVTVWGFAVPHKRNLPTQFHFRPNQIAAYYFGPKARGEYWKHLTATMYRRLMTSLLRYRIGVHPYDDREGQSRSATAYLFEQREGNKVTALDFVEFDRNTQLLLDHGVDLLYAGCFLHQKMSGDSGEYWRSFMPKMYEHLQARGWDKSAFVYGYDEFPPAELADVREQYAVVKELAPTVKYLLTYYKPDCAPAADDPGYADIWVPSLGLYSPQLAAERKRHGQTTWAYVVPGFEIYRSNRDYRRLFRTIWQQRCAGFLYFCTAFLHWNPRPADLNADGSPRKTFLRPGKGAAGIYHLCYPAGAIPEDGLNASIRLEAIRDGLEDWEYFNLLKDLIERAPQPDDQLVETARQVMRQVDDPSDKTDPASQRRAVARMIELLSR